MSETNDKQTTEVGWERIAAEASSLFLRNGYKTVGQRDIADALGIKAASLYHHCPKGKAQLFERSVLWRLARIEEQLRGALSACETLEETLTALVQVLRLHPVIDQGRLSTVDVGHLSDDSAERVMGVLHQCLLGPFVDALDQHEGLRDDVETVTAAVSFLAAVDVWLRHAGDDAELPAAISQLVQLFVRGLQSELQGS